jgi:hypothetical protein
MENLVITAANLLRTSYLAHLLTRFGIQSDDEIRIATDGEIQMQQMKFEALDNEHAIRIKPKPPISAQ